MRYLLTAFVLIAACSSATADSNEAASCFETAMTQVAMNECAGWQREDAEVELDRVISEIRKRYADEPEFLEKMEESQQAWAALQEANLEMRYPLADKRSNYGSVYPMCAAGARVQPILARIEFLKEWLVGHGDGEVCGGSVKHSYCLENDCSKIGN